jgi:hypothetical protein
MRRRVGGFGGQDSGGHGGAEDGPDRGSESDSNRSRSLLAVAGVRDPEIP